MNKDSVIQRTEAYVRQALSGESSGHDWWHVYRVWNNAKLIAQGEKVDHFTVEMAALLHDIGDPKLHNGDTTVAPRLIGAWLDTVSIHGDYRQHILYIVANMSFSKHLQKKEVEKTLEFMVVQDADRLDAIGAIGIARAFAYGGHKGRLIYDPTVAPVTDMTADYYRSHNGTTINHFYEKLLHLKDLMNTPTAKRIAAERHRFMEQYLQQFYDEWEGKT